MDSSICADSTSRVSIGSPISEHESEDVNNTAFIQVSSLIATNKDKEKVVRVNSPTPGPSNRIQPPPDVNRPIRKPFMTITGNQTFGRQPLRPGGFGADTPGPARGTENIPPPPRRTAGMEYQPSFARSLLLLDRISFELRILVEPMENIDRRHHESLKNKIRPAVQYANKGMDAHARIYPESHCDRIDR